MYLLNGYILIYEEVYIQTDDGVYMYELDARGALYRCI